ncbi:MAG: hypothetical protein IID61_07055 [SAR324 cluster bacterium]|nr:hypothetical protein [SAR324 cluster bacterium]
MLAIMVGLLIWLSIPNTAQPQQSPVAEEYIIEYTLRLPKGTVHDVLYSPNERFMVTLGATNSIRIWEVETSRAVKNIRTGDHKATLAIYHPKEEVIFTGGRDNLVMAWDISKGTSGASFEGQNAPTSALTTDAEGAILFSGANDGTVAVWDTESGKLITTIEAHQGRVTALALHPDGKHLATGGRDQSVRVWDWKKGKQVANLGGHIGAITAVKFHFKPDLLASSSADGTVKLWRWREKENPNSATLVGHKRAVTDFEFHPNEEWLLTASLDKSIFIWDIATQTILQELTLVEGPISAINLSVSGRRLIAAYDKDRARTWKLDKSAFLAALEGHTQSLVSMDFASNPRYLISGSQDKSIRIWDLSQRKVIKAFPSPDHVVQVVRFAPGDREFATGGTDGTVRIWNTQSGKVTKQLKGHKGKVNAIAFHPRDARLLSGGSDKTWILWDTRGGTPVKRIAGHIDQVTAVAFSRDGSVFATGSGDKIIRVWSYPSGKLVHTLKGHEGGIEDLQFDPQGLYLASASKDGTIRVWNPKDGSEVYTFKGHDFIVSAIRFSIDGRSIISVSRDKTVKLWDVQTGKFLRTVAGQRNQIVTMALSPDSKVIATGSVGKVINLMVYPLEVILAEKEEKDEVARVVEEDLAEDEDLDLGEEYDLEKDLSALEESSDEPDGLTDYRKIGDDDSQAGLHELEAKLNDLMKAEQYCGSAVELERTAYQVLRLAPYDKAAFHALVNAGIVNQDLKLIYLTSLIGQRALFLSNVYDYATVEGVDSRLDFWQKNVFNPARIRSGKQLVLEFVDCDGQVVRRDMPATLLSLDIPVEVLRVVASKRVNVDFEHFRALDDKRFLDRIHYMIAEIMEALRRAVTPDSVIALDLSKAPQGRHGVLNLDISSIDIFGYPDRTAFRLRKAKGLWHTYYTDKDRRKSLLLPVGNYYLRINKKLRRVFTIKAEEEVPLIVTASR